LSSLLHSHLVALLCLACTRPMDMDGLKFQPVCKPPNLASHSFGWRLAAECQNFLGYRQRPLLVMAQQAAWASLMVVPFVPQTPKGPRDTD
jgi:hypothetical protein